MSRAGRVRNLILIGAFAAVALAASAGAQAQACGDAVAVEPGDTLTRIAERCGASVLALLAANPEIADADVIRAGQRLALPEEAGTTAGSLLEPPDEAHAYPAKSDDSLSSLEAEQGTSVAALIEANPGLDPAAMPIGRIIATPGRDDPARGAPGGTPRVSVSAAHAAPGQPVTIHAGGFPANADVEIGAGPPHAQFDILARARSDQRGEVRQSLQVPRWASQHRRFVFVAQTPDGSIRAASEPVRMADREG